MKKINPIGELKINEQMEFLEERLKAFGLKKKEDIFDSGLVLNLEKKGHRKIYDKIVLL